jgi:hypothetical protein
MLALISRSRGLILREFTGVSSRSTTGRPSIVNGFMQLLTTKSSVKSTAWRIPQNNCFSDHSISTKELKATDPGAVDLSDLPDSWPAGADDLSDLPGADDLSDLPGADDLTDLSGADDLSDLPGADDLSDLPDPWPAGADDLTDVPGADDLMDLPGVDMSDLPESGADDWIDFERLTLNLLNFHLTTHFASFKESSRHG